MPNLLSLEFEIFGRVQGVFFRKYTQKKATELGLAGWVRNTSQGTVQGVAQGPAPKITSMKTWLQTTGSPSSQIEKAEFKETAISTPQFKKFSIDKTR
ncbi:acylphosphatase-1-like [Liolophura sinensis]|uniref:acylphosphatase-1-like n=1 Tax=Liolophura sinensis TaxID=3198878 RepID=UPI00315845A4